MMLRLTKKRFAVGAVVVCALVVAAGAYAYFTAGTGSGTATGTVGSATTVTLHGNVTSNLYPGASSPVTFTVDNPSSGVQRIGTISLVSIAADASHSGCVTTVGSETSKAFYMAPVTVNASFASGNGQAVTPTGTLQMRDTGVPQDNCQGATLTLTLASN
jgi:hypothetical protein